MVRWWRSAAVVVVASVLAPALLLVVNAPGAEAATAGPWTNSVETDSGGVSCPSNYCPDQSINCHFQARWGGLDDEFDVSTTLEIRNGYCDSWLLNRPPEDLIFYGTAAGGGDCSKEIDITADQTSFALNPHREWSFGPDSITTFTGCDIDSWQVVVDNANDVFGTIDLGDAEVTGVAADGCVAQLVDIEIQDHMGVGSGPDWPMASNIFYRRVMLTVVIPPEVDHLWLDSSLAWTGGSSPNHNTSQGTLLIGAGGNSTFNAAYPFPSAGGTFTFPLAFIEAAAGDPRASGWTAVSSTSEGAWTGFDPASASGAIVLGTEGAIVNNDYRSAPPNPKPFHLADGQPDGTDCTYWMNMTGTPVADHTAFDGGVVDDEDPGATPSPASDEGSGDGGDCEFSISDPSTWATAGICALVKLMRQAVGWLATIAGAIGDIASAILDGLAALFVPDAGTFANVSELRDAFSENPPGSVLVGSVDVTTGLVDGLSSTCGETPDFTPDVAPAGSLQLPNRCDGGTFGGSADSIFGVIYLFVRLSFYALLAWRLWDLGEGAFKVGE